MTPTQRPHFVVRIDETTGQALEVRRGSDAGPHVDGTTQYHLTLDASAAEALAHAERLWRQMAPVRAKIAREATMTVLRPATFVLPDGEQEIPGWTFGHTWNGWARPYLSATEAWKLVHFWNFDFTATTHAHYDAATDTFIFADDNADEPDAFAGEQHVVDGQTVTLYPIGNGCWCWEEV